MPRLELRVRPNDPVDADIILRFRTHTGFVDWVTVIIDTGAEATLLPLTFMERVPYRLSPRGRVAVEQAGISKHRFEAVEAYISVYLEDFDGQVTGEFETIVWFADTEQPLLGVTNMLDRAILHIDMPNLSGYLEFPD